jgi:hypothetical protein
LIQICDVDLLRAKLMKDIQRPGRGYDLAETGNGLIPVPLSSHGMDNSTIKYVKDEDAPHNLLLSGLGEYEIVG